MEESEGYSPTGSTEQLPSSSRIVSHVVGEDPTDKLRDRTKISFLGSATEDDRGRVVSSANEMDLSGRSLRILASATRWAKIPRRGGGGGIV